ncbi:MAG TPA: pyruvate kinase, partial [Thermomonas sp.]|nr:pyruvate kinase [Thermomonas sp.]
MTPRKTEPAAVPHQRRTRIVATLGPATDPPEVLEAVLRAGVDVVRLNFSHGDPSAQVARGEAVRAMAAKIGREVGILADLPGPKIRVETFAAGKVALKAGNRFDLVASLDAPPGDETQVGVSYLELTGDVKPGDVLLLDDGIVQLQVDAVEGERIVTTVLNDCMLSNRKGLNKQGGGLSLGAITEKDRELIVIAAGMNVDFIAVSFCRNAEDMNEARRVAKAHGSNAALVAKIERAEAIENLTEIVDASDVVMVARGDLGVEIGDAELPGLQKKIIRESLARQKVVITATQMLQSMVDNPIPTRAEVLDVANAVIDGTDVVMLSQESAAGSDAALCAKIERAEAIENLAEICAASESVMVARGDLGVEIGDAELPGLQKKIIRVALEHNRVVITATQMLQSMVDNPIPTRAEVLDVANAVIDGTDAVMLSAETASGRHPVKA